MTTDSKTQVKSGKLGDNKSTRDRVAAIMTIFVIAWFALFVLFLSLLVWNSSMQDAQWTRYVYLLTGIESVTFTAVGWLFGKEVHREQAMDAKQQAKDAMDQATQARDQTTAVTNQAMGGMEKAMGGMEKAMGGMEKVWRKL